MDSALGSILSTMSTLPMLREVLQFLKGWDFQTSVPAVLHEHGKEEKAHGAAAGA